MRIFQATTTERNRRRGVALLMVLACVVLLAVLVIAFLASIGTEMQSSKLYANGASVKLLSQSTVAIAMAEIRDATADGSLCWASQPGMIRTFKNDGTIAKYYKLYSDDTMVTTIYDHTKALVPDGANPDSTGSLYAAWYKQKGVYVDLNQPISVSGINQYPIVDGDYSATTSTGNLVPLTLTTSSTMTTILPSQMTWYHTPGTTVKALGPLNGTQPAVSGFWVNSNVPADTSNSPSFAPMPVKWLYVLQDGEIATPDSETGSGGSPVKFSNAGIVPTQGNPIVGRIAFWTDDETCKVNVNTASEGTYWDIPRSNTYSASNAAGVDDSNLEYAPPINGEYQRYPGHPATTSLSAVFSSMPTAPKPGSTLLSSVPTGDSSETIYSLTPKLGPGGSGEGRVQTVQGKFTYILRNQNPLYTTPDEYIFQPTLTGTARPFTSAAAGGGLSSLDQTVMNKSRFFITASSRAPDVNVFNQPRISIWPISLSGTNGSIKIPHSISSYDQLIAFCSSMRTDLTTPYTYYFQRTDPTDNLFDLPTSGSQSGLGRNRMLLEYLRNLTKTNIPGFGGTLAGKYNTKGSGTGTDCDQILTEIFDYIRSTDLGDPSVPNSDPYTYTVGAYIYSAPTTNAGNGKGQVIPIEDAAYSTRGFGRFKTILGMSVIFIANADGDVAASQPKDPASPAPSIQVAAGKVRLQMCVLPQLSDLSPGSIYDSPSFNMNIGGMDGFKMGSSATSLTPVGLTGSYSTHQSYYALDHGGWGDQQGFRQLLNASFVGPNSPTYIDVPKTGGTFYFSGGTITVSLAIPTWEVGKDIGAAAANGGVILQTATFTFLPATLPLPTLAPSNVYSYGYATNSPNTNPPYQQPGGPFNMRYFNAPPTLAIPNPDLSKFPNGPDFQGNNSPSSGGRFATGITDEAYTWITDYDVVRSVAVASDPRLVAAQKNPPASLFSPVGAYNSGTSNSSAPVLGTHTLFDGEEMPFYGAVLGRLVASGSYDNLGTSAKVLTSNKLSYAASGSTGNSGTFVLNEPGGIYTSRSYYNFADCFDPATGNAINGVSMGKTTSLAAGDVVGDWDSGVEITRDGPFINKADEGDQGHLDTKSGKYAAPYDWKGQEGGGGITSGMFTPNRMMPSAVMFGSLPTGVFANKPWQTLLFRPGPMKHTGLGTSKNTPVATTTAGTDQGPPYSTPPDHLFLDLFSMPVVEPYAISEPLSTAGRINMNHLIVPFTYINRDTGLRAVLKSEKVVSIPDSAASNYKYSSGSQTTVIRFPVNIESTLSQFYTRRFNNNDIFRSPSEICDIDIVPLDTTTTTGVPAATSAAPTRAAMDTYWNSTTVGHRLTGDNARERIYATIYPRLTTKSNTFTVHFRVQTLKQALTTTAAATAWNQWREGTDVVTGEYRGSQTIERYVDPNDTTLPDFADPTNYSATLAPYYKFRVISTKQFAP